MTRGKKLALRIGIYLALLALLGAWLTGEFLHSGRASNDRNASASLKTIGSAQEDFRSNDRDGNGKNDYWRGDVAGLYVLVPKGGGPADAIKLIDLSVAAADARPKGNVEPYARREPKAGFWFQALRFRGEATPDPDRWAACAYPMSEKAGRYMYILSHEGAIFRKAEDRTLGMETYPDDPLKEGWEKLD